jgi:hypothetical protein
MVSSRKNKKTIEEKINMYEPIKIHLSHDEARAELKKRWENVELRKAIEEELGENFWKEFKDSPRGLLWKNILSPDNGFMFFYQCCNYIGIKPIAFEFLGDMYMSFNEEKKGLGQLCVELENGKKAKVNIMDLHKWNKKKLSEVIVKKGETLVEFHRNLLKFSGYEIELRDNTMWTQKNGKPGDWYYFYLLHFVAHGVLFESFSSDDDKDFLDSVVYPAVEKIEKKFGLRPIVVSLYPDPNEQSEKEDFFWWSYPANINDYIVNYSKENNLIFKEINLK